MDTLGAAIGVLIAYAFLVHAPGDYSTVILWSIPPAALGVMLLFLVRERSVAATTAKRALPASWRSLPVPLRRFLMISLLFTLGNSSNTFLLLRSADFGFTPARIVLLYLVYNISYALFSYPAGKWSDRIGRRAVLTSGYVLYAAVYAGFAFSGDMGKEFIPWILFFIYGLYSAATDGVEKAFIADLAPKEIRASVIGLHAMIVGIGLLPASLLAGLLWSVSGPGAALGVGACTGVIAAGLLLWWGLRPVRPVEGV
jgi:MFS family permease